MEKPTSKTPLPDVARERESQELDLSIDLKWVGMQDIEARLLWPTNDTPYFLPAKVQIQVSLDKGQHRGIHMSRLFLIVQEKLNSSPFSFQLMNEILNESLFTHAESSQSARVRVDFEIPKMQKSLKSQLWGTRNYPASFEIKNTAGHVQKQITLTVLYSSTCPASSALSRQLMRDHFHEKFSHHGEVSRAEVESWLLSKEGMVATPHAQRSWARLAFELGTEVEGKQNFVETCEKLIEEIENTLGTPVQSAVKRVDEQEFARLNGKNMMFCEDAARKLKGHFNHHSTWKLMGGEVHHVESLHPHEAVAFF